MSVIAEPLAEKEITDSMPFFARKHIFLAGVLLAFFVINVAAGSFVGFDFFEAVTELPAGLVWFAVEFMPTEASLARLSTILPALGSTVLVSVAASVTAAILAYLFAVVGSRSVGLGGPIPLFVRAVASVFRNIPIVAWAFLLLFSFKQSEFTGYLALFLQSFGFLTRCFLEGIDEISLGPVEALRASGATYLQVVFQGVVPLSITQVVSWVLYMVETNIRDATLVGMLTGTGIGFVFDMYYKSFRYDAAGLVIVCIALVVIACELFSNYIRRQIMDAGAGPRKRHKADASGSMPSSAGIRRSIAGKIKVHRAAKGNVLIWAVFAALAVVTIFTFARMDYGGVNLASASADALQDFATMALTPRVDGHFTVESLVTGLFVTLALALLTTLGGAVITLFLGLVAACNLSNKAISNVVKVIMSVARAVPTILWVLVFTVAIGLGPEAAVIGMLFHSVAYLVKAYSESFEEVDPGVLEALRSTGATWWQIVLQCVIPEKLNEVFSWTFIRFEINFVAAVVVAGMAGSGGIGYSLFLAGNYYFDIHEIGLIVYLCLGVSVVLEVCATKLRKRYIVSK